MIFCSSSNSLQWRDCREEDLGNAEHQEKEHQRPKYGVTLHRKNDNERPGERVGNDANDPKLPSDAEPSPVKSRRKIVAAVLAVVGTHGILMQPSWRG
jgi:hypothetical protein